MKEKKKEKEKEKEIENVNKLIDELRGCGQRVGCMGIKV